MNIFKRLFGKKEPSLPVPTPDQMRYFLIAVNDDGTTGAVLQEAFMTAATAKRLNGQLRYYRPKQKWSQDTE